MMCQSIYVVALLIVYHWIVLDNIGIFGYIMHRIIDIYAVSPAHKLI